MQIQMKCKQSNSFEFELLRWMNCQLSYKKWMTGSKQSESLETEYIRISDNEDD